jgi:N-acyl-D-amino-acid deacylase
MTHFTRHLCLAAFILSGVQAARALEPVPQAHWQRISSPAELGWSGEKLEQARRYSATIDTAAVMVVQDGIVVDEWGPTALPLMCHSVRKSLLSALYGPHVAKDTINLDHTLARLGIDDCEPSLTAEEKQACVRDLLMARSGVYHPALYETAAMAAARPDRGSHTPNSFWYYNNWDFNACGTIFENLTGRSIFEEFEDQIAGPLQFEDFGRSRHTKYVTGDDSVHPAYPFQLSTRDLARFGLLFLRNGRWGHQQIIPQTWVEESTASYSDARDSGGYGYMWWVAVDGQHFPGVTLPQGSYSARGFRGQYLVVIPERSLVVCHRVNSFQKGTSVSRANFGKLLAIILDAAPATAASNGNPTTATTDPQYDLIIRNGTVIDGTGQPGRLADVAVSNGTIAAVGSLQNQTARRIVDATGKIVCPGFIDLHSHADSGLVSSDPARRSAPNLVTQGITTVVINQDGSGPLSLADQKQTMQQRGIGLNAAQVIGHGTIRRSVMGGDHRRPATAEEINQMRQQVRDAMAAGAFGMSAGLEYVPGRFSTPAEMEALAAELAPYNGTYIVHERSSGSRPMWFLPSRDPADQPSMLDNIQELVDLVAETGVTTVATHIKARGTDFWGSSGPIIERIQQARSAGLPLYADQYPYNTSGSDGRIVLIASWVGETRSDQAHSLTPADQLEAVLQDEALAKNLRQDIAFEISRRGGASGILIVQHPDSQLNGMSLADFADTQQCDAVEAAIRLQLQGDRTRRGGARLRAFSMSEKDVEAFAKTPWTATSSDAGITLPTDDPVHPRFYGAFPRKIRHYAIDRALISLEEAVRVSTSLPAEILKLKDRGTIRPGAKADLVVFDRQTIRDTADAFHPHQYAEGIDYVFVNGQLTVDKGRWLGRLAGEVLTHQP